MTIRNFYRFAATLPALSVTTLLVNGCTQTLPPRVSSPSIGTEQTSQTKAVKTQSINGEGEVFYRATYNGNYNDATAVLKQPDTVAQLNSKCLERIGSSSKHTGTLKPDSIAVKKDPKETTVLYGCLVPNGQTLKAFTVNKETAQLLKQDQDKEGLKQFCIQNIAGDSAAPSLTHIALFNRKDGSTVNCLFKENTSGSALAPNDDVQIQEPIAQPSNEPTKASNQPNLKCVTAFSADRLSSLTIDDIKKISLKTSGILTETRMLEIIKPSLDKLPSELRESYKNLPQKLIELASGRCLNHDALFAQILHTTDALGFSGKVSSKSFNVGGIKKKDASSNNPSDFENFLSLTEGLEAFVNHVQAYTYGGNINSGKVADRTKKYVIGQPERAGTVSTIGELTKKMGTTGTSIEQILYNIFRN
jgi:hypothetical protein